MSERNPLLPAYDRGVVCRRLRLTRYCCFALFTATATFTAIATTLRQKPDMTYAASTNAAALPSPSTTTMPRSLAPLM